MPGLCWEKDGKKRKKGNQSIVLRKYLFKNTKRDPFIQKRFFEFVLFWEMIDNKFDWKVRK
jgi:hypothetical protein